MKSVHKYDTAVWIDLKSPSPSEVDSVIKDYRLDPELGKRMLYPSIRHAAEFGENHAYLVFHFPAFKDSVDGDAAYEVDFVIGKDYVITVRYGEIKVPDASDVSLIANEDKNPRDVLFFGILESLIASYEEKLVHIDHWIRDLEQEIFEGREKETILQLSEASRHLIDFKKITAIYPDTLTTLRDSGRKHFGKNFAEMCDEVILRLEKARAKLETLTEAARELRETNYSLLSTKQNELVKFMSVLSVIIAILVGIALIWVGLLAVK